MLGGHWGFTLPTEHTLDEGWTETNAEGLLGVGHRVLSKVGIFGSPSPL